MAATQRITARNLAQLAWAAGHRGVTGLAKSIRRHRVTVYRAVREPNRHRPTFRAIHKALGNRKGGA
jgi:hypothetical protein